jgi:hypothetical protein
MICLQMCFVSSGSTQVRLSNAIRAYGAPWGQNSASDDEAEGPRKFCEKF